MPSVWTTKVHWENDTKKNERLGRRAKVKIVHHYKLARVSEVVFASKNVIDGVSRMRTYLENWKQTTNHYHELLIRGKVWSYETAKEEYGAHPPEYSKKKL